MVMIFMFQMTWTTSGRVVVCVTSPGVTGQICSQSSSMAGSGLGQIRRLPQLTPPRPPGIISPGHRQVRILFLTHNDVTCDTIIMSGHLKIPQPDNAEEDINGSKESCLGLLNNIYEDGIR